MRGGAQVLGVGLLGGGTLYLGFAVDRTEFWPLIIAATVAFAGYAFLLRSAGRLRYGLLIGLALRLALVFAFPRLSDDVYRFLWDGNLVVAGQNPFAEVPAHYMEPGREADFTDAALFAKLNSPTYHSVYPPLLQGIFAFAVLLSPQSWYGAAVIMKLFLLLAEVGTVYLLYRLLQQYRRPIRHCLVYWLNPLILIEITGNLHAEGLMVFFLLLSLWLLNQSAYARAGCAMALSIASKLLPLMLLPYLLRRLWRSPFWRYFVTLGGVLILLVIPVLAGGGQTEGFGGSLNLYFRKFEFNASLYYLLRAYGFYDVGYNRIAEYGPLLARVALGVILIAALSEERTNWSSLPGSWLGAFVVYLLCATTVHPWYLSVPVALCCLTPWRYPIVWSYLILLTYASYTTVPYRENLWLVGLEYLAVLAYFAVERRGRIKKGLRGVRTDLVS